MKRSDDQIDRERQVEKVGGQLFFALPLDLVQESIGKQKWKRRINVTFVHSRQQHHRHKREVSSKEEHRLWFVGRLSELADH